MNENIPTFNKETLKKNREFFKKYEKRVDEADRYAYYRFDALDEMTEDILKLRKINERVIKTYPLEITKKTLKKRIDYKMKRMMLGQY